MAVVELSTVRGIMCSVRDMTDLQCRGMLQVGSQPQPPATTLVQNPSLPVTLAGYIGRGACVLRETPETQNPTPGGNILLEQRVSCTQTGKFQFGCLVASTHEPHARIS